MIVDIDLEDFTGVRISLVRETLMAVRYDGFFKRHSNGREREVIEIGFNHFEYIKRK